MAIVKSYTDLEQSKVLTQILPLKSADMHYYYDYNFNELESIPAITEEDDHFVLFPKDVRCWSLAALLNVLPNENMLVKTTNSEYYCIAKDVMTKHYNNPVDACVTMIEKLHKSNLL